MPLLRSFLLPLMALVVVCLWIGLAVWYGVDRRLLDDETLIELLDENRFYAEAADSVREIALDAVRGDLTARELQAVEEALSSALTEEWVRSEINRNLLEVLAYARGDAASFALDLDFREPKARLGQELRESTSASLVRAIEPELDDVPDTIDLASSWGLEDTPWMQEVSRRRSYFVYVLVAWGVLTLVSFLLAGVAGGMQWTGTTAVIAGVLLIILFTVGLHFGLRVMEREVTVFATQVAEAAYNVGRDVLRAVSAPIRDFGIVLTVGGAALIVGSVFYKRAR